MPVQTQDPKQLLKGVVLGFVAVGAAVGFFALVLWFTDRGSVEISIGDDTLRAGRATSIAEAVDRGGPIIYADLLGGTAHVIVQHLGDDSTAGWYVFDLVRPGQTLPCQLQWHGPAQVFRDTCDPSAEVPPTGLGQPSYPVEVTKGELIIYLRGDTAP